jgi:hypothetical protein
VEPKLVIVKYGRSQPTSEAISNLFSKDFLHFVQGPLTSRSQRVVSTLFSNDVPEDSSGVLDLAIRASMFKALLFAQSLVQADVATILSRLISKSGARHIAKLNRFLNSCENY